jgi:ribonucleoside-triphosphate reductase
MGQSVAINHLGKYLRKSYNKYLYQAHENGFDEENSKKIAEMRTNDELKAGIQTIQYQINTLMTSNG